MADPHASEYGLKDLLNLDELILHDSPSTEFSFLNDLFDDDTLYADNGHKDEFSLERLKYERHMEYAEKSEKKVLRDQKRIADIDIKIGKLKDRCENLNIQKERLEFEIIEEREAIIKHKREAEL